MYATYLYFFVEFFVERFLAASSKKGGKAGREGGKIGGSKLAKEDIGTAAFSLVTANGAPVMGNGKKVV
jgi:hypothetical protein